jgi:hypothetical protein
MVGSGRLDILGEVQFPRIVDQRVGIGSMVFGTTSAVLGGMLTVNSQAGQ